MTMPDLEHNPSQPPPTDSEATGPLQYAPPARLKTHPVVGAICLVAATPLLPIGVIALFLALGAHVDAGVALLMGAFGAASLVGALFVANLGMKMIRGRR